MGLRLPHPFRTIPGPRVDFLESGVSTGIGSRGVWATTKPPPGTDTSGAVPGMRLSYVIFEQSHNPARALGVVLLMIVLVALAFVVAAQG